MARGRLMYLRSITTLHKTKFHLNHRTQAEFTVPPKQGGEHTIHHHNRICIYPEIMTDMADGTQIKKSQIERGKHVALLIVQ